MFSRLVCSICIFSLDMSVRRIPNHNLLLSFGNRTHVWSELMTKLKLRKFSTISPTWIIHGPFFMFFYIIKWPIFKGHALKLCVWYGDISTAITKGISLLYYYYYRTFIWCSHQKHRRSLANWMYAATNQFQLAKL